MRALNETTRLANWQSAADQRDTGFALSRARAGSRARVDAKLAFLLRGFLCQRRICAGVMLTSWWKRLAYEQRTGAVYTDSGA